MKYRFRRHDYNYTAVAHECNSLSVKFFLTTPFFVIAMMQNPVTFFYDSLKCWLSFSEVKRLMISSFETSLPLGILSNSQKD